MPISRSQPFQVYHSERVLYVSPFVLIYILDICLEKKNLSYLKQEIVVGVAFFFYAQKQL